MIVVTMNRETACYYTSESSYAMISISTPPPNGTPAPLREDEPQRKGLLRLEFSDISYPSQHGMEKEAYEALIEAGVMVPFKVEHAAAVASFLAAIGQVETLVVHCDAGISRSVSMGQAIRDALQLDGRTAFVYNKLVYDLTRKALRDAGN